MMCFSLSRYRSTSFALLQICHPLHGIVPLQHLATCFKRAMPETKLPQVEYLVNLSVPMEGSLMCNVLTISVGRISLSFSESTRSYSCGICSSLSDISVLPWSLLSRNHRFGPQSHGLFFIFSTCLICRIVF